MLVGLPKCYVGDDTNKIIVNFPLSNYLENKNIESHILRSTFRSFPTFLDLAAVLTY